MEVGTVLKTAATSEPVTLEAAKEHLRVDSADFDTDIALKIRGARSRVEAFLKRRLITQVWTVFYDCFDGVLDVPLAPVQSVDEIRYVSTAGVVETLSASLWQTSTKIEPTRILPAYGASWPLTRSVPQAVEVDVTVGYGNAMAAIEPAIVDAVLLTLGDRFENREDVVVGAIASELPTGARNLLLPYVSMI